MILIKFNNKFKTGAICLLWNYMFVFGKKDCFQGNPFNITVIQDYVPTANTEEA